MEGVKKVKWHEEKKGNTDIKEEMEVWMTRHEEFLTESRMVYTLGDINNYV